MAKLPVTCAVNVAANPDGTATVTVTRTAADGSSMGTSEFRVDGTVPLGDILHALRESNRDAIGAALTLADLPANFSVQIGLDATMRELDLL